MKRILSLFVLGCLLLCGCSRLPAQTGYTVNFYYVRSAYREDMTSLMDSERRDPAGHQDDLSYLLALYLIGPSNDELISPIPSDTELLSVSQNGNSVTVELSDTGKTMSESHFALSCACLSMTCLDLTGAETVTVTSGSRTITMTRSNLFFTDHAITNTEDSP